MNTISKIGAIALIILLATIGCQKEETFQKEQNSYKSTQQLTGDPGNNDLLMTIDAKELAQLHNQFLRDFHKKQQSDLRSNDIEIIFLDMETGLTDEMQQDVYDWIADKDMDDMDKLIKDYFESDNAITYYNLLDNAITDYYDNPQALSDEIHEILGNAESNVLDVEDLQVLKIFGETSVASSDYWFNEYKGGEKSTRGTPEWVRADGRGAASASIGWAVLAWYAGGPVAPATYLIAVGIGAGLGSIMNG